ncbi:MAG TPA: ATP-binding protein [Myxococcaceae bacterium]|nr:ATP-binding protein [Myxococcaceae bacterium]
MPIFSRSGGEVTDPASRGSSSPSKSSKGWLRATLDWFMPAGAARLSRAELFRLRMAVGGSLLLAVTAALVIPGPLMRDGFTPPAVLAMISLPVMLGNALAPRLLGARRLPGYVLCLWSMGVVTINSSWNPDLTRNVVGLPLLAGLFANARMVWLSIAVGVAQLIFIGGPLSALPQREAFLRIDLAMNTVLIGVLVLLFERLRGETEHERDEAREENLELVRQQAVRDEVRRAQARLLRFQVLRVEVGQRLAEPIPLEVALRRSCESVVHHLDVSSARLWLLDEAGTTLELKASAGKATPGDGAHARVPVGTSGIGLIARDRLSWFTNEVRSDPRVGDEAWARSEGLVAFAGCPILFGNTLLGVLAVFATEPLPEDTLPGLEGVVDTMAQSIERKRAEEALAQRAEDLARSNAELERFAYVASHDLQEPLRMVASYTQMLRRRYQGRLDADADEFIRFAVEGVNRMKLLIQDLLDYSRVGRRSKELVPVPAAEVLDRSLADLRTQLAEAGGTVTHDALPVVMADRTQLGQLFTNLLSNALKFRRRDVAPRIHVSASQEGNHWVFSVRDNGIGIEPQYFERIFVLFQRLHTTAEYPGTGIGLAVCKKIVEGHGGRMRVESTPGQGTTFVFTLPVALSPKEAGGSPA